MTENDFIDELIRENKEHPFFEEEFSEEEVQVALKKRFQLAFMGRLHPMTPKVEKYFDLPHGYAAELASGSGIMRNTIYGVTLIDPENVAVSPPITRKFDSRKEATDYLGNLCVAMALSDDPKSVFADCVKAYLAKRRSA